MSETDWNAFAARLRTYVGSRVEPRWVEDVVGDVLLRLVRHRDAIGTASNPLAYVLRVAANAVTDHHRRRAVERRALTELDAEPADLPDSQPGALDEDAASREIARCVLPFIRALPGKYRDAMLLTEIDGLTQVEAARRLGISNSGMKSRVQRGRSKIRQSLLRCCMIEIDRRGGIVDYDHRGSDRDSGCQP